MNALVIVSFFLVATFVIVFCYKFNFNRVRSPNDLLRVGMPRAKVLTARPSSSQALIGYMMLSSAMLLGMLGGNMVIIATTQMHVPVDVFSLLFAMYNFAVVGVVAIFYQKGTPKGVTQMYLVLTSVIMAWQLSQFPEWSTWALVVVLAFYDLCAVLTPCGPLKWLVHLVQQEGRPLPGQSPSPARHDEGYGYSHARLRSFRAALRGGHSPPPLRAAFVAPELPRCH